MAGLVEELQREALDPNIPVSSLLRKVKITAMKLQLPEAIDWADAELTGYTEKVPEYRILHGRLMSFHPYTGSRIVGGDPDTIKKWSKRTIFQPISSLESIVERSKRDVKSNSFSFNIPQEIMKSFNQQNGELGHYFFVEIDVSNFVAIIDRVRSLVLDWALGLETAGITGEGISFTMAERENATASNITIGPVHGNVHAGDFTGGQQRNYVGSSDSSINSIVSGDLFDQIRDTIISQLGGDAERMKLLASVDEMKTTKGTPRFVAAYQKFVHAAGDHMNIIGPFMGPLATLLAS
jgi:hypothetical protein